ncbi:hypothetical protein BDQ12DRAFT_740507 [Crucibulum laeve]|uniref:Uncharacterized protein n=1 Tax=Crucibulum laeve TaxID=68775 RepID=A0A5C3MFD9_9AGAR|nr:hypothetical protein BDQ12DRAFT_740507 [Crucibulum laeve]
MRIESGALGMIYLFDSYIYELTPWPLIAVQRQAFVGFHPTWCIETMLPADWKRRSVKSNVTPTTTYPHQQDGANIKPDFSGCEGHTECNGIAIKDVIDMHRNSHLRKYSLEIHGVRRAASMLIYQWASSTVVNCSGVNQSETNLAFWDSELGTHELRQDQGEMHRHTNVVLAIGVWELNNSPDEYQRTLINLVLEDAREVPRSGLM